jgi:MFS family permease
MTPRSSATGIMTMFVGFTLGGASGGFVAAALLSQFGWQSVFVVGGIFPCLAAAVALAVMDGRAVVTVLLWVMFFMSLLVCIS